MTEATTLRNTGSVLGTRTKGFDISEYEIVDISEIIDVYITDEILVGNVSVSLLLKSSIQEGSRI